MHRLEVERASLDAQVKRLRRRLDPSGVHRPSDLREFPVAIAHELYYTLVAPAEPLLDGVTHLMVVPDGALTSLPFSVLVTEAPEGNIERFEDYRSVPWLFERYALTTLPSVGSLRALRVFAHGAGHNTKPFAGFGDPVLEGDGEGTRGINLATLFSRGAVANSEAVRQLLPLPETAEELLATAAALGAPREDVHLQDDATETNVKSMDLTPYRVVSFATHGLMAGDFAGWLNRHSCSRRHSRERNTMTAC